MVFRIQPHVRLHEWVAQECGFFTDEGLDYVFEAEGFAAGTATVRRGELPPAVQDAPDPGLSGMYRQPGPAGLLVEPADQRCPLGSGPVPGRGLPGATGELVADTQEQQRHRAIRVQADNDRTHGFRVCHAVIMWVDVSPARSGDNG
jgi:hypothetical protein